MSTSSKTLTDSGAPQKQRPLITFGNATVGVVMYALAAAFNRRFLHLGHTAVGRFDPQSLTHTTVFGALYYVLCASALLLVYATRNRANNYVGRVIAFTVALSGILIGIVDLVLPLRSA
jgi:hypothetical protein